jgi:RNA polymerase sigma-70 factor (ECF subfamily)
MLRVASIRVRTTQPDAAVDDPLVAAAQADPAAFEALYDAYLPRVYRFLAARAVSPEEATDLTQAVFVKAWQSLDRFKPGPTPFASWLFRIARNTAIDARRRVRPAVPWAAVVEPAHPAHPSAGSPEEDLLQAERIAELRSAIGRLDPSRRELLALRYGAGLTAAEIAPIVGKRSEAVKKQLQRILHDLKEHYRDQP